MRIITVLGVAFASIVPALAASRVQALESYRLVTLTSAHFAAGRLDLSTDEKTSLDDLAKRVCHTGETVIELRGYADGAGSSRKDVALSAERARAVERFLIERGVACRPTALSCWDWAKSIRAARLFARNISA